MIPIRGFFHVAVLGASNLHFLNAYVSRSPTRALRCDTLPVMQPKPLRAACMAGYASAQNIEHLDPQQASPRSPAPRTMPDSCEGEVPPTDSVATRAPESTPRPFRFECV
jgi:hypothetical protein